VVDAVQTRTQHVAPTTPPIVANTDAAAGASDESGDILLQHWASVGACGVEIVGSPRVATASAHTPLDQTPSRTRTRSSTACGWTFAGGWGYSGSTERVCPNT
jgi:hypothetical protein